MGQNSFKSVFEKEELLGRGSFATVWKCRRICDDAVFAVKVIKKKHLNSVAESKIKREIDVMKKLKHEHCVSLYNVFTSRAKVQFILELCTGGHLLERLGNTPFYSERDAARIMQQLALACQYMHSKGVVHRDLKPENIIYKDTSEGANIKVTDFGLSTYVEGAWEQNLRTPCGTPAYVAPEVLQRQGYGCECDLWSMGVILYVLVSGFPPFYGSDLTKLCKRIIRASFDFSPEPFQRISDEAKEVITLCLQRNAGQRVTPGQLLKKPWINGAAGNDQLVGVSDRLRKMVLIEKFKRGVHLTVALQAISSKHESFEEN